MLHITILDGRGHQSNQSMNEVMLILLSYHSGSAIGILNLLLTEPKTSLGCYFDWKQKQNASL